ncbi:hypothetical protein DICSQDRAFT_25521, partial [Dichomitus squalens LYAD-421 SS1]|uniref:uncharacterized protein n=1 Tax=Dichomitus squalens (strain LYAD-421) TaxID=732165 RepID=UPI0004413AEA
FSVRPFSPSETWSFPKPPTDNESGRVASAILSGSLRSSTQGSAFFTAEDAQTPEVEAKNPFADPENPFADLFEARPGSATTQDSTPAHFAPIEMVRRPFVPTVHDEIAVDVGDQVRVIRRFDDGWAVVENVTTGVRGLIPIDCLRAVEEELPAFLAKKRISSYVGPRASVL